MRCPGVGDRRERKGEETVSMVCDAVGDFASAAGDRHTLGGSDDPGLGPAGKTQERYRSCGGDAESEKEAVRLLPKEDSMRTDVGGNDGLWTRRKTKRQVFHRAHSPWKSQTARFPHSHRRDEAVEKWKAQKQAFHFPTPLLPLFIFQSERRPGGGSLRSRLQAHSWMRICCNCSNASPVSRATPACRLLPCASIVTIAMKRFTRRCHIASGIPKSIQCT